MINFWSIVKLTLKLAIRSYLFQVLQVLLLSVVFLLPNSISGDGTASGFIQISIKYSLAIIVFILSLSTIWLSCYTMNSDLYGHQLHLIFTKAIPRWKVWIAKCLGIFTIHLSLLLISGVTIYTQIMWQYDNRNFSKKERVHLENEVFTGRRCFYPQADNIVDKKHRKTMNNLQFKLDGNSSKIAKTLEHPIKEPTAENTSRVKFGPQQSRLWSFNNLPINSKTPVFLRYRIFVENVFSATGTQRKSVGLWSAQVNENIVDKNTGEVSSKSFFRTVTPTPEIFAGGTFHEIKLPSIIIDDKGKVILKYTNFDSRRKDHFFQPKDGPTLLIKVISFLNNYLRALFVYGIWLAFVTIISCAFATITSLFSAIFITSSYLIIGVLITFVISNSESLAAKVLQLFFVSGESFDVSNLLADGRIIELSLIFNHFIFQILILKGIPFLILGTISYTQKEIGLVIKK